ncbi:BLUF domain-containing protein [Alsobacter metallidurans]|uniref:BLUF domain-containing protein n=1 Tax=Alsobacter metallidurans TaxID=340221 RepID=UPI002454C21B|nr:BLUF domain-containing protein [Alsobacter metallidurans]
MPFRAIYVSSHILPVRDDGTCEEFDRIAEQAHRCNAQTGVSFFLVCTHHWFCQVLEGSEPAVRRTLARIAADKRHFDCRVIEATAQVQHAKLDGYATVHKSIANRLLFLERGFSRAIVPYDRTAAEMLDLCNALRSFGVPSEQRQSELC